MEEAHTWLVANFENLTPTIYDYRDHSDAFLQDHDNLNGTNLIGIN